MRGVWDDKSVGLLIQCIAADIPELFSAVNELVT